MYESRPQVAGAFVSGQLAKAGKDETTLSGLNRNLLERANHLLMLCNRLDDFADRVEPQPRGVSGAENATQPPMPSDFNGLSQRIDMLTRGLERFQSICDRLDRIA
jgi:hypothetical protein